MKPNNRLPRTARISDDGQASALRVAARVRGRWFIVRRLPSDAGYARMLVRVAKKVMKSSVARNRIRRCVKDVFRHQRNTLPACDYFVSLIHPYARNCALLKAQQELERLLRSGER